MRHRFRDFVFDSDRRQIERAGQPLRLSPKAFQLLELLIEAQPRPVPKSELIRRLWPDTHVEEGNLKGLVAEIRAALGEDDPRLSVIRTVHRLGYAFDAATSAPPASPRRFALTDRFRGGVRVTVAAVLGAVAGLSIALLSRTGNEHRGGPPVADGIRSLAVLPLENLSRDPAHDYFAYGMTEAINHELSKLPGLTVISRRSTIRYKGSVKSPVDIARELSVDALVDGAVSWSGNRVRINVVLVNGRTGHNMWGSSHEGEMADVLTVQMQAARAIARALNSRVPTLAAVDRRRVNSDAYDAYLRGMFFVNQAYDAPIRSGIEHLERSLRLDSGQADTWAALAAAYADLAFRGTGPPHSFYPKAKHAAEQALSLDPALGTAHAVLGQIQYLYLWDWGAARKSLLRAIELEPSNARAHSHYAGLLTALGRFDEAVAEFERVRELDPYFPSGHVAMGWIHYMAGRRDEAISHLKRTIELFPSFDFAYAQLARNYMAKGLVAAAIEACQTALRLEPSWRGEWAPCGWVYARAGRSSEARELIAIMMKADSNSGVNAYELADVHAGLNDRAEALRWLHRAREVRHSLLVFVYVDPVFAHLREEPEYQRLVDAMGLRRAASIAQAE